MNLSQNYGWYIALLGALLPQIPLYLAYLVGSTIALMRWSRHPRASLYLLISIFVSFITQIIVTAVQVWLPYYLITLNTDSRSYAYYFYGLSVIANLIHALTFGLLLLAVFSERTSAMKQIN